MGVTATIRAALSVLILIGTAIPAAAQGLEGPPTSSTAAATKGDRDGFGTFRVRADSDWVHSGVRVRAGETVRVRAWGRVRIAQAWDRLVEPSGIDADLDMAKLVANAPAASLIAVVGDEENDYIVVGRGREFTAPRDGVLFFGLNQIDVAGNSGAFEVRVTVAERRGLAFGVADSAPADRTTTETANGKLVAVAASRDWTNTYLHVRRGDVVTVVATGTIALDLEGHAATPDGVVLKDPEKLLADKPTGALIAVIGVDNNDFFYIGPKATFTAARDGLLFLGVNEGDLRNNTGEFTARVTVTPK